MAASRRKGIAQRSRSLGDTASPPKPPRPCPYYLDSVAGHLPLTTFSSDGPAGKFPGRPLYASRTTSMIPRSSRPGQAAFRVPGTPKPAATARLQMVWRLRKSQPATGRVGSLPSVSTNGLSMVPHQSARPLSSGHRYDPLISSGPLPNLCKLRLIQIRGTEYDPQAPTPRG